MRKRGSRGGAAGRVPRVAEGQGGEPGCEPASLWPQGLSRDCSGVRSPARWVDISQMAEPESRSLPTRAKFCAPPESGKWVSRRAGVLGGLAPSERLWVLAREAGSGGDGDPRESPGPARRGAVPGSPPGPVQPASPAPGSGPCVRERPARLAAPATDYGRRVPEAPAWLVCVFRTGTAGVRASPPPPGLCGTLSDTEPGAGLGRGSWCCQRLPESPG